VIRLTFNDNALPFSVLGPRVMTAWIACAATMPWSNGFMLKIADQGPVRPLTEFVLDAGNIACKSGRFEGLIPVSSQFRPAW